MSRLINSNNTYPRHLGEHGAAKKIFQIALTVYLALAICFLRSLSWASGVVTNTTEANLRAAISGGGLVTFACDGTITLANTITNTLDTVIDATGHQITISGGGQVRVFFVNNVNFTIRNVSIVKGLSTNNYVGSMSDAAGGAIYNYNGSVNAINCVFMSNSATALPSLSYNVNAARGGAVYNTGSFTASACSFLQNSAVGGSGVTGISSTWWGMSPLPGGAGGSGSGGAICNEGAMIIDHSLFASNSAAGAVGGRGGNGFTGPGPAVDQTGGYGGPGADGGGAAVADSGSASMVDCTFTANTTVGGSGGDGGYGGYIWQYGWYPRGNGGNGGSGLGVINDTNSLMRMTNCTVAGNTATVGSGGSGWNQGANGSAWGGIKSSGSGLMNSLLSSNFPGGNGLAQLVDYGHNLSSDASCGFTNVGSMNNTDPKLAPLGDNGGPTLTMALLPGSPAIDFGDTSAAPFTDQRGFPRPAGLAADIGAFEFGSMLPVLTIARSGPALVKISVQGNSNQWCRILASSNLSVWVPVATNQFNSAGTIQFQDDSSMPSVRFYRVTMP
jgi:hypothetical protein